MKDSSLKKFEAFTAGVAKRYGVSNTVDTFSVKPTDEQALVEKVTHNADFLQKINYILVDQQTGQKVLGSISGLAPKRTKVEGEGSKDREPQSPLQLDGKGYQCEPVEFDYLIKHSTIDAWAKFKDFDKRFLSWCRREIALSQIKLGWYGEKSVVSTDVTANPNGEDVKAGWLQSLRDYKTDGVVSQVLTEGEEESGVIKVGKGGDYENLDALVHDTKQLINEIHRNDPDLVAIIGSDLLATDKAQLYVAQGQKPTEKERVENQSVTRTYGGLPSMSVPFFPGRGVLITKLSNLSIYVQSGSIRQAIENNNKRNRVEHYNSMNMDYLLEDESAAAMVEFKNVQLPDGKEGWQ